MRILGMDVGDRRIGLAISDPTEILASPLTTVERENDEQSIKRIMDVVKEYDVKRIVIGMPYSLQGKVTEQTAKTIEYFEKLRMNSNIELVFQDERLSSMSAKKLMTQVNKKRIKRKGTLDAAAAAVILQGYLDAGHISGKQKLE